MKKWFKKMFEKLKLNLKELRKTISYISKLTGYFRVIIFFDIVRCYFKYGADYDEYRIFEFYNINRDLEDTYLTKIRHDNYVKYLYNKNNLSILKDRREFYKKFDKYLKRNTCYSKNLSFKQKEELIYNSGEVVCKSNSLKEENTKLLNLIDFRSPAYLIEEANNNKLYVFEESFQQNKIIDEINPYNINILSIVTLKYREKVDVVSATIKFGTSKTFEYDYKKSDYITGFIDLKTGKVIHNYRSRNGKLYIKHPVSNIKITPLEIPYFKKAIDTALKCAQELDEVLEVEWNFAIGKNKVYLIGANLWEDYIFSQVPEYLNDKVGLMPYYRKHIDKTKKL